MAGATSNAGQSGASVGGTSGAGPGDSLSKFVCNEVQGLLLTSQWYLAGFEKAVDDARWQLKWAEHSYIDEWAKPDSRFWATAPTSPCAQSKNNPDRVLFTALSWDIKTQAEWQTDVGKVVDNIKTNYPRIKQIVLMTIIRGPANKSCGDPNAYETTAIPAYVDAALAAVAAQNPNLVKVRPKFEASACSDFSGTGPHLTNAGNAAIAKMIAAHYANE